MIKKLLRGAAVALFWIGLWWLLAAAVGTELLIPSPPRVAAVLFEKIVTAPFWIAVGASFARVTVGFAAAVAFGALLGFLTARFSLLRTLFSPPLHIVRAAPVASFILLALIWIRTDLLPGFIAFLMGMPIVWEAVQEAALRGDREREEVARVFRLGRRRTFRYVTLPAVFPSFLSAAVTCLGFCWKSAVAAEVICRPRHAIGSELQRAKILLETPDVFCYTVVTVLLSILLERLFRSLLKRYEAGKEVAHADPRS